MFLDALWLLGRIYARGLRHLSRARALAAAWLRGAAIFLLFVAVWRPLLPFPTTRQDAVILLDASRSMGPRGRQTALAAAVSTLAPLRERDQARAIVFGRHAELAAGPASGPTVREALPEIGWLPPLEAAGTNLRVALGSAGDALRQSVGRRRVVLFTDGCWNMGGNPARIPALPPGTRIDAVEVTPDASDGPVAAVALVALGAGRAGAPLGLQLTLAAARTIGASCSLYRDEQRVAAREIVLRPGLNVVPWQDIPPTAGEHRYRAVVTVGGSMTVQETVVRTGQAVRVLCLGGPAGVTPALLSGLKAQGLDITARSAPAFGWRLADLSPFAAVVFDNVPAYQIPPEGLAALGHYLRDLGGGLLVIGGDRSFNLGGYAGSKLEDYLPLRSDPNYIARVGQVTLVFLLDCSGSMSEDLGGFAKFDLARSAVQIGTERLRPYDLLGVVTFNDTYLWSVPLGPPDDGKLGIARLSQITAAGGTNLHDAAMQAVTTLIRSGRPERHLIVVSDGKDTPHDYHKLHQLIREGQVHVTAIAVGDDVNESLLRGLAKAGRGRYLRSTSLSSVPRLLLKETATLAAAPVTEKPVVPLATAAWFGEPIERFPALGGYLTLYARPGSMDLIVTPAGAPIMTSWHLGRGLVVAFAGDAGRRFGRDWVAWPDYGRFWTQCVRWICRVSEEKGLCRAFLTSGEKRAAEQGWLLALDLVKPNGELPLAPSLAGVSFSPDGRRTPLVFTRQPNGRYVAGFAAGGLPGLHNVVVEGDDDSRYSTTVTAPDLETGTFVPDHATLAALVKGTGGRVWRSGEAAKILRPTWGWHGRQPLAGLLVILAALCFVGDLLCRYLPAGKAAEWRSVLARLSR